VDYVGLDPVVGLECVDCKHILRLTYSELLDLAIDETPMHCAGCSQDVTNDWTTVNIVQNIIRKRMREAQKTETKRWVPGLVQ
jgi:hypothetical protein